MDIGFLLKKIVGVMVMPLPIFFTMLAIAVLLLWRAHTKQACWLIISAILLLLFFSLPITSRYLIWPTEFQYPKLQFNNPEQIKKLKLIAPQYIVVLGCWHNNDEQLPLVAKIHPCSLPRIIHGVQLQRILPNAKILFSGFQSKTGESHPEISARLAMALGVSAHDIITVEGAKDTEEGINRYKSIIKDSRFIVVSSATHMHRVKTLFAQHGLEPILAPAEYVSAHGNFSWYLFVPNAQALYQSERAIYEFLGNIWVNTKSYFTK